jgi:predicted Zn-dependent protease
LSGDAVVGHLVQSRDRPDRDQRLARVRAHLVVLSPWPPSTGVGSRGVVTPDPEPDEIPDLIAATSMREGPLAAVRLAEELLGAGPPADGDRQALLLQQVGDYRAIAGDLEGAEQAYREAIDTGGATEFDVRASLIDILLQGDRDGEARALAEEVRRGRTPSPSVHLLVGEAFEAHGHLDDAHAWLTRGVRRAEEAGEPADWDRFMLMQSRRRVREAIGLPQDEYDEAVEDLRSGREHRTGREDPTVAVGVLHWPKDELRALLARWPDLADGYGRDWDEHRRRTEETLNAYADGGMARLEVAAGSVADFERYAAETARDPAAPATRAAYAAQVVRAGGGVAWPPGRNSRCWCGSGGKYKRCCGRRS